MRKEEILNEVRKHQDTVLSFPNRGEWGQNNYRGNCSGWIHAFFLDLLKANSMAEVYAGGGTGYDVCKDMGIPYVGIDLNPTPVRDGIVSMDILDFEKELPEGFYSADMVFAHPPYPGINKVKYSNNMWKGNDSIQGLDIQNMSIEDGMNAINKGIMRVFAAQKPGSFGVVLVGNVRVNGGFYSMAHKLAIPGEFYQSFVKIEHNCVSNRGTTYARKGTRALTAHEDIIVFRKPSGYEIAFVLPKEYVMDIRDSLTASWIDVVLTSARELKKNSFTSQDIYHDVAGRKKASKNNNVEAKIRQTLQRAEKMGKVIHLDRGQWCLAVA